MPRSKINTPSPRLRAPRFRSQCRQRTRAAARSAAGCRTEPARPACAMRRASASRWRRHCVRRSTWRLQLRPDLRRATTRSSSIDASRLPAACLVLAMVGIPLGLSARKGGKSTGFVLTILLVFVYYLFSLIGRVRWRARERCRHGSASWMRQHLFLPLRPGSAVAVGPHAHRIGNLTAQHGSLMREVAGACGAHADERIAARDCATEAPAAPQRRSARASR